MKLELFAVINLIRTNSPIYFNVLLYSMVDTAAYWNKNHNITRSAERFILLKQTGTK